MNRSQRTAAAISVINRLVDPVSEHGIHPWLETTALPEIFGENADRPGDDRFYRASDLLLKHRDALEHHIRQRQGTLFNLDRTILLYDLTNTHFEGCCESNPKAAYGKNKQGRNDCLQVVVGMVFDKDGFELAHKVFEGNRNDGAGDNRSWAAIKRVMQTHGYATIVLPTKSGTVYRIRKPGVTDLRQRAIYESLGINLSQLPATRMVCEEKSGATL